MASSRTAAALIDLTAFHLIAAPDAGIKQRILEEELLEVRAEILSLELRKMIDRWRRAQVWPNGQPSWPPPPELN